RPAPGGRAGHCPVGTGGAGARTQVLRHHAGRPRAAADGSGRLDTVHGAPRCVARGDEEYHVNRQQYLGELTERLFSRGVPPEQTREIVAEVESHLIDSGDDPIETFGLPDSYAASVVAG